MSLPSHHSPHAPNHIVGFNKMVAVVCLAFTLTACQTTEPGGIEVRTVEVPVPQPCLPAADIPAEPGTVAHLLNGMAAHDLSVVAASALELRAWGQEMHTALVACAG